MAENKKMEHKKHDQGCGPECKHDHGHSSKEQDIQKKYMELQLMGQQIKEVQKQMQAMESQMTELEATSQGIEELSKTKERTEMFVPLSSGVFAKAELKDSSELLVNVGAGVAVKKKIEEVRKMVDSQAEEINNYRQQIAGQLQLLISHAQKTEKELKELVK